MITLEIDRRVAVVGDTLRARASWQHDKTPKEVRVELRWYTEGRGDTNSAVADRVVVDRAQGPIPPSLEATLTVPTNGPITYDGVMIRVRWQVRATLGIRWGRDPRAEVPLLVRPYVDLV